VKGLKRGTGTNRQRDLARGAYLFRVTEDILVAMEDQGVSKAELAQRLGKSKARISQLLGGSSNMTIGTLADIAFALGLTLDKTFKEYSARRHRLTSERSRDDGQPDREIASA
jgi:transcriptional regulator with XRE-family HTH domain